MQNSLQPIGNDFYSFTNRNRLANSWYELNKKKQCQTNKTTSNCQCL